MRSLSKSSVHSGGAFARVKGSSMLHKHLQMFWSMGALCSLAPVDHADYNRYSGYNILMAESKLLAP